MKKNNKIFVVTSGCYSDYGICRIFSTEELAKAYINGCPEGDWNPRIEEYPLDEVDDKVYRQYWTTTIALVDGMGYGKPIKEGEVESQSHGWEESPKTVRCIPTELRYTEAEKHFPAWGRISSKSYVSEKHSLKLATEAYQAWLRDGRPHHKNSQYSIEVDKWRGC